METFADNFLEMVTEISEEILVSIPEGISAEITRCTRKEKFLEKSLMKSLKES